MEQSELAELVLQLKALHRRRVDFHRAEKRLTLQVKAICRRLCGGSKTEADVLYKCLESGEEHDLLEVGMITCHPLLAARDSLAAERKQPEKQMEKLAKQLPVWKEWAAGVKGFGVLGLAQIVAEAGDLSNYSNPAKLWKRMGVGLVGGERQRLVAGDVDNVHGYSPERRSILFCIGDSMIKTGKEYRQVYLDRKQYEVSKAEANGLQVVPAAKITAKNRAATMSQGHVHRRAQRYMEKRLLRDLWVAWRKACAEVAYEEAA